MNRPRRTRRSFLIRSARCAAGGIAAPGIFAAATHAGESDSRNDRIGVGAIGLGGRGSGIARQAARFGDLVARCDVDRKHLGREPNGTTHFTDYRKLLELENVDVVTIGTPDHWHTRIAIDAMKAGKDVYCEKPLTLTIDEGKLISRVVKDTGRVLQVGTQQRSEFGLRFLRAVAMVHGGRVGKLQRVVASTGGGKEGGPFKTAPTPSHLDWEMWLGQAPLVPYTPRRCHGDFRWWREYAGGQMTDWGAHHVDIALWAIGLPQTGKMTVEGSGKVPRVESGFNMPAQFDVTCRLPNGVELQMVTGRRQGVHFTGSDGELFVSRGTIEGEPVERLQDDPLAADAITKLYRGKRPGSHMGNFFECVRSGDLPISDVYSHHRHVTVLHLANLCVLLGRKLTWDLGSEQIIGDGEANRLQRRDQRKGYEIRV